MKNKKIIAILTALALMAGFRVLNTAAAETTDISALYKNKDVETSWSTGEAKVIDLNTVPEGGTVHITEAGEYVLSGALQG